MKLECIIHYENQATYIRRVFYPEPVPFRIVIRLPGFLAQTLTEILTIGAVGLTLVAERMSIGHTNRRILTLSIVKKRYVKCILNVTKVRPRNKITRTGV